MRLEGLIKPFVNSEEFLNIKKWIEGKNHPVEIDGLSSSSKAYFYNAIYEGLEKSVVVITPSDLEAKNVYEDLNLYLNNVYYFPAKEVVFYNIDAISGDLRWARLKVIKEILQNRDKKIVITSIDALTTLYTPRDYYYDYSMKIVQGAEIDLKELSHKLIECGYERVEAVEGKGEFSFRGGILDVFPPTSVYPYRIELFGDEVDSIRSFNTESQRSIEKVESFEIFPAKEIIINDEVQEKASEKIKEELNSILDNSKKNDKERIEKLTNIVRKNLELLKETYTFETVDSYLPYFYDNPESIFDYFEGFTFIMDDAKRCSGKLESIYYEFNENYMAFLQRGDILPSQNKLLLEKDELLVKLNNVDIIKTLFEDFNKYSVYLHLYDSNAYEQFQIDKINKYIYKDNER